jgi:TatA/E family protein of Tat protein translocase
MFGLGGTEVVVIFVLALLLFGPRKLPEIGRTLGKTLAEFRRATLDFRVNLEREVELDKLKSESLGPIRDIVGLGEPRASVPPPVPLGGLNLPPLPAEPKAADNAEIPAGPPSPPPDDNRDRQA